MQPRGIISLAIKFVLLYLNKFLHSKYDDKTLSVDTARQLFKKQIFYIKMQYFQSIFHFPMNVKPP